MSLLLTVIGLFAIATTLLPLWRKEAWWVRVWDFPRLQIAALAAVSGLGIWLGNPPQTTIDSLFILALAGCSIFQAARVLPYTRLGPQQVQRSRSPQEGTMLRLLCANVQCGNRNVGRLLEIVSVADPDIILAVEPDNWWQEGLRPLEKNYPYRVEYPLGNTYGMLLYSRLQLLSPEIRFLVQPDIPSIHALVRLRNGSLCGLHCVHPRPPVPPQHERSTERDAELLLIGRELPASDLPQIVMGDLNDVAWSSTTRLFQKVSGLLDPRRGRGLYNTFHAKIPLLRFSLDHVFHSSHFRVVAFERLPYFGSDHFPVFICLNLEPGAVCEQPSMPAPDADERATAQAKIART